MLALAADLEVAGARPFDIKGAVDLSALGKLKNQLLAPYLLTELQADVASLSLAGRLVPRSFSPPK